MKYIYYITIGNKCYIGQSAASDNDSFSRVRTHIYAAYKNTGQDTSEPDLLKAIRSHDLNEISFKIYTEPNYGFDGQIYKEFFKNLRPYGKRVSPLITKNTKNNAIVNEIEQDFVYDELMKLDAAEILHIAYASRQQGFKVVNAEMGGQYYGWCLASAPDTLILQRSFTPAEALRVLDYIDLQLGKLQSNIDQFFAQWLKNSSYWQDLQKMLSASLKKSVKKTWREFIGEQTTKWFWDPQTQTGAWVEFSKELKKYLKINVPTMSLVLRRVNGIQDTIVKTITDSFSYRIRMYASQHPTTTDINKYINELFTKNTFTSGRALTLSFSQLVDLKASGIPSAKWWNQTPTAAISSSDSGVQTKVKQWATRIFHDFFVEATKNTPEYTAQSLVTTANEIKLVYPNEMRPTLSKKIHDLYRKQNITASFVTNKWTEFYGPMISYTINNYKNSQWELEDNERHDKKLAYRDNKVAVFQGKKLPVAHSVREEDASVWLTSDLSQITVY